MGDGNVGTVGKRSGKACKIASPLSKATRPKTMRMFVTRKKTASLLQVSVQYLDYGLTEGSILYFQAIPKMQTQFCPRFNNPSTALQFPRVDYP